MVSDKKTSKMRIRRREERGGEKGQREVEGWGKWLVGGGARATWPRSDHLRSRSPTHGGEGGLRDPVEEEEEGLEEERGAAAKVREKRGGDCARERIREGAAAGVYF